MFEQYKYFYRKSSTLVQHCTRTTRYYSEKLQYSNILGIIRIVNVIFYIYL